MHASAGDEPSIAIAVMPAKAREQRRARTKVTPMNAVWWKSCTGSLSHPAIQYHSCKNSVSPATSIASKSPSPARGHAARAAVNGSGAHGRPQYPGERESRPGGRTPLGRGLAENVAPGDVDSDAAERDLEDGAPDLP
eukprot:7085806-Prymnesium_polylepis.2